MYLIRYIDVDGGRLTQSSVSLASLRGQRLAHLSKKKPLNHNELLDLQFFLEQIGQVRVSSAVETLDETTVVDFSIFRNAKRLHVCIPCHQCSLLFLGPIYTR